MRDRLFGLMRDVRAGLSRPTERFHHKYGGFMSAFFRTMLLVMTAAGALAACSEPTPPPTPPPKLEQPADSTSHAYTWEYAVLGGFGSTMSAVAADGDDNVWAVGNIDLGYEIASTPPGRMSNRANAVHITPQGIEMFAVQAQTWQRPGYIGLLGVTMHDGEPIFWWGLSRTQFMKDSVDLRFFPELNGLSLGLHYYQSGSDGHVYQYGGSGYLGRFIGPRFDRYEQLPTGTAKPIRAFTQVGPNEFYIGGWSHDSTGGIFHHLRDGQVTSMTKPITEDTQLGYAMAMWSSSERLHAYCPPYFYMQSLVEPYAWDALHGRMALDGTIYGAIICAAGRADNDVFYAGHYATVIHYNGRGLHYYEELPKRFPNGCVFYDIAVTPNHVFLVGEYNGYPILVKGTKAAQ
jgi:hypothetical protein